jgi:hypothetical protein
MAKMECLDQVVLFTNSKKIIVSSSKQEHLELLDVLISQMFDFIDLKDQIDQKLNNLSDYD